MYGNVPYTYLIEWPELNLRYYGVRYAKNCHPKDFWVKYFTSSKEVAKIVAEHGDPPVREIRRTFDHCIDPVGAARRWEERVLKTLKVGNRNDWLNVSEAHAPPIKRGDSSPMRNPSSLAKFKATIKSRNIKRTPEQRAHQRAVMTGRIRSDESKQKQRATIAKTGKLAEANKSDAKRKARSIYMLSDKNPSRQLDSMQECSYCNTMYLPCNANYHEDNCRQNPANKTRDFSRPKAPCKYCGKKYAPNQLPKHERTCSTKTDK